MNRLSDHPYLRLLQELSRRKKLPVFLVGGALRDQCLGRQGYDLDFAVPQGAVVFSKAMAKAVKGAFVLLDEEHPCGRVVKRLGQDLWTFDFSDYRAASLQKDLALRDFTINTLCAPIDNLSHMMDEQGAMKDLKSKTIRMVYPRAFADDPLRLMRAFSLQAQLGFKIEPKTFKQIQKDVRLIHRVSIERVREEWFKVLSSSRAYETILLMEKAGLLDQIIPQLDVMKGVFQGGYHHLDVWKHSLEVVRQFEDLVEELSFPRKRENSNNSTTGSHPEGAYRPVKAFGQKAPCGRDDKYGFIHDYLQEEIAGGHKRYALLKFACLLHDIGKPDTRKKEGARMSFHGHEHVGSSITRIIAKQIKVSVKERYFLEDMVTMHLRPGYLSNFKKPSERMVFRFLRDAKDEALSVLLLALADQRGTRGKLTTRIKHEHHRKICWQVIEQFIQSKNQKPLVRLLTGHDLIKRLKLKPSPLFAEILSSVQEAQVLGKISTLQEALELARKIAKI